jgi:hypothetical protein
LICWKCYSQFAAGVLVALIDSFTPNQMGAADCPLLNNVKTALRLLLKKPFLGLFTHILTDLKPERDKFLKLICECTFSSSSHLQNEFYFLI